MTHFESKKILSRPNHWHSIYASDALAGRRKKTHSAKLEKFGLFELPKSTRILDVACGEGEMLDLLAERGFIHLTGLDPSQPLRTTDSPKPWLFVQGNSGQLPFEKGAFDVVLCAHALHHFSGSDEIARFLKEAERILCPGGRLYLIDHFDSWQLRLAHFLLMSPLAKLGSWTSAFHDQLCSERTELNAYVRNYPAIRSLIFNTSFSPKRWRQDFFFFYFEGHKSA